MGKKEEKEGRRESGMAVGREDGKEAGKEDCKKGGRGESNELK